MSNEKNEKMMPETVSYYDHQEQLAREERHTDRWRKFAIIIFAAFIISNAAWIIYESTFQDVVVTENTQDGGGTNIYGGGNVTYEPANKDNQDQSEKEWNE